MRFAARASLLFSVLLLAPSAALAQAAITGVVKDTSGAVLPGVTVEAASPVLIEKVRTVVSDTSGQYRIVDLRPGTYSVTFSLPGFSTVKREGIELTGTFVATVNGDLRVGALEETITVTGETPIVDVQSARTQQTLSKDIVAAIPSARLASSVLNLIPGMVGNTTDVGGSRGMEPLASYSGSIHGSKTNDGRLMNDGLSVAFNNAGGGMYMANMGGAQELAVNTSGGLGENEVAGVIANVIPRDGGNTFSGSVTGSGASRGMQGDNYTQKLKNRGLTTPSNILKTYDFNPTGGGRIVRDRLWFYETFRLIGAHNTVPGMFINKNAGDITKWTYDPDTSRQAFVDNKWGSTSTRLAFQATPRNKVNFFYDLQWRDENKLGGGLATTAPEAHGRVWNWPSEVHQVSWSSPATNRVLLEAGYGDYLLTYRLNYLRPGFDPRIVQAQEQVGAIPGLLFRAPASYSDAATGTRSWRAAVSYVTGAHNMKFGYQGGYHAPRTTNIYPNDYTNYRFSNGVANRVTQNAAHEVKFNRHLIPNAVYAQDSWTLGRLTLQGGVRYDMMVTRYPDQSVSGPSIPVPIVYPAGSVQGVHFHDITPRMGAAYDLFGDGKTAIKVSLGHFPTSHTGGSLDANPLARLAVTTATRSWTDTNKNLVPECDLQNLAKNGECGAASNQNFGKNVFSTNFDPAIMSGWGVRADQWEFGASVQQQVLAGVSVNVGYFRRWYGKFTTTDNLALTAADFDKFSIVAPVDSRLPNGGGQTITDLYDVKPAKFGQTNNLVTAASNFGNQIENWHGVDVTVTARTRAGLTVQGGLSTGRTLTDNCEIRAQLPELGPTNPYCRVEQPFLNRWNGLASYTIPRAAVQVSATWRSNPQGGREDNPGLAANLDTTNALIAPSLGRNLAGNLTNVPVNLVAPATFYGDRVTSVDLRVAKILRFGRTKTQVGVDIFNVTNTDAPLTFNETFVLNGSWLTPLTIQPARFFKISASFDF